MKETQSKQESKKGMVRIKKLILLALAAMTIFCGVLLTKGTGPDSDNDSMSDEYENFFHLDPTNSADADLNYDSDTYNNRQESEKTTDPWITDTDRDGFTDNSDSNPVSRAYFSFGNPWYVTNNQYQYVFPAWLLLVYQTGGEWTTNPLACWH